MDFEQIAAEIGGKQSGVESGIVEPSAEWADCALHTGAEGAGGGRGGAGVGGSGRWKGRQWVGGGGQAWGSGGHGGRGTHQEGHTFGLVFLSQYYGGLAKTSVPFPTWPTGQIEVVFTMGDARSFCGLTSKTPPFGFNVFNADVKETTARHQCENRFSDMSLALSANCATDLTIGGTTRTGFKAVLNLATEAGVVTCNACAVTVGVLALVACFTQHFGQ